MKVLALTLSVILTAILIAGCVHKPSEYQPVGPAQTAVFAYCKQKVPNLVVIKIEDPKPLDARAKAMVESMAKAHGFPIGQTYRVVLSDPKDDSLNTSWMVTYQEAAHKVAENATMPGPCVKDPAKQ
ncbi:MAG TPA: hypothetical protein VGL77_02270 [Armatimonadota bacterium]|jgi:PBP1b-binding outer membrane lipoprotein LpoB